MPLKSFERTIPFIQVQNDGWYPIVEVVFIKVDGQRIRLPLLFDTGATQIVLHPDWAWLFPKGDIVEFNSVGDEQPTSGTLVRGTIEFLGQVMDCTIGFAALPKRTWMAGLFGRECFTPFGFGFWESARELYVTLKP